MSTATAQRPTAKRSHGRSTTKKKDAAAESAVARYEQHRRARDTRAKAEKREPTPNDVDVALLREAVNEGGDGFVKTTIEVAALEDARIAALNDPERGKGKGIAEADREKKAAAAKPTTAAKSPSKSSGTARRYPDEIRAASKRARDLLGGKHAPGPKQHVAVRKVIGDRDPAEVAGVSATALKRFAQTGELAMDKRGNLGEIAEKVGDPWARGRSLAAILTVLIEERR